MLPGQRVIATMAAADPPLIRADVYLDNDPLPWVGPRSIFHGQVLQDLTDPMGAYKDVYFVFDLPVDGWPSAPNPHGAIVAVSPDGQSATVRFDTNPAPIVVPISTLTPE
jgi:hypothetical protein